MLLNPMEKYFNSIDLKSLMFRRLTIVTILLLKIIDFLCTVNDNLNVNKNINEIELFLR